MSQWYTLSDVKPFIDTLHTLPTDNWSLVGAWRRQTKFINRLEILTYDNSFLSSAINDENFWETTFTVEGKSIDCIVHFAEAQHRGYNLWKYTGPSELVDKLNKDIHKAGYFTNGRGIFLDSEFKIPVCSYNEMNVAEILKSDFWKDLLDLKKRNIFEKEQPVSYQRWVESSGSSDSLYLVQVTKGHRISCTCLGYQYNKDCKHTKALREELDL